AAVLLAPERVEDRLPRSGGPHGRGERGQEYTVAWVVPLEQHAVAPDSDDRRDVVVLGRSDEGVQQQAVHDLQRRLLDVLVSAMDGVSSLETDDRAPTALGERAPGVGGIQGKLGEGRSSATQQPNVAGDDHLTLRVE